MRAEAAKSGPVAGQVSDQTTGSTAFSIPATPEGTRAAILRILRLVDPSGVAADDLYAMEIALAEGLNNIVEHAYQGIGDGRIEIRVTETETGLAFEIWDDGAPMPTGRLPLGHGADPGLPAYEQAEGGYGLFLLRQLARKLRYERVGDRNRLAFRIALGSDEVT